MSDDDWENELNEDAKDAWDAPAAAPAAAAAAGGEDSWEDEVDLVTEDLNKKMQVPKKTAAQLEAERRAAEQQAKKLAARVQTAQLEEETAEQRLERERAQQEESEVGLIGDLMGGGVAQSASSRGGQSLDTRIATAALGTKKDHEVFAKTVAERLRGSTPLQLNAFCLELFPRLLDRLTPEQVRQLADMVEGYVKKAAAAPAAKPAPATGAGKKKKQAVKKFQDTFGGDYDYHLDGDADHYVDMEDDFM